MFGEKRSLSLQTASGVMQEAQRVQKLSKLQVVLGQSVSLIGDLRCQHRTFAPTSVKCMLLEMWGRVLCLDPVRWNRFHSLWYCQHKETLLIVILTQPRAYYSSSSIIGGRVTDLNIGVCKSPKLGKLGARPQLVFR
jgi:hypothetical protein